MAVFSVKISGIGTGFFSFLVLFAIGRWGVLVCFGLRSAIHTIVIRLGTFPFWDGRIPPPGKYPVYILRL